MLSYDLVKDDPVKFLACTSLTLSEFAQLLVPFTALWLRHVEQRRQQPAQRQAGAGRKAVLRTPADKLFFILFYVKTYSLQAVMATIFGLSQSQVNEWIHTLAPVLKEALGQEQLLPNRDPQTVEQILAECPTLEFLLDGTERRRQRPIDPAEQRRYYSGKKKAHTYKNNVIVEATSQRVIVLSETCQGTKHDKKLSDEAAIEFPPHSTLCKDTGFQGYEPTGVLTFQPQKKRRGQALSVATRFLNKLIASVRMAVEHVICGVKRCRIVKDVFRNTAEGFSDLAMEIACGLHNLRVSQRQPASPNPFAWLSA